MLSRQGNIRAYGPDASDPVRLVGQIAAILSIAAGVIHISAAGDHTDLPVMFAGFLLVAALQIGLGALLISRPPSRLVIAAAIAMTVGSIAAWVLSRSVGLQFIGGEDVEPVGFKDGVTKLFEIASIPVLLLMLSKDLAHVSVPPRLGTRAITVLGTACLALMPPALLLGGHTHSHAQSMAMGVHDEHSTGTEVAHAGTHSSDPATGHGTEHSGGHHPHGSSAHSTGDHALAGHHHSDVEFASAPLGATHQHGAPDTQADPHHTPHSGGDDGTAHHGGTHRDRSHANHHGGEHGGGHGGHGDHGGEPGSQDAITISYEPSPSVCVSGAICIP